MLVLKSAILNTVSLTLCRVYTMNRTTELFIFDGYRRLKTVIIYIEKTITTIIFVIWLVPNCQFH